MKTRLIALTALFLALMAGTLLIVQDGNAGRKDEDRGVKAFRASQLNGLTVRNKNNDNLAHIDDIVLDLQSGRLVYYAIAYGKVVGFGGRLIAVAPEALHVSTDNNNRPQYVVLNATKDDLDKAKAFDSNDWPRHPQFGGHKGGTEKSGTLKERVKEVKETVKEAAQKGKEKAGMHEELVRVSALFNTSVQSTSGAKLGSLFDVVADVNNNKAIYAAVSHGGTAGIGGKLYAVPWSALEMKSTTFRPGSRVFVINATEEEFNNARGFVNNDTWPSRPDTAFKGARKSSK
jgi:sporulation protein YlmC with PRC-barrel domain